MDPTKAPPAPPGSPGHYGPGYGEVPAEGTPPDPDATPPVGVDPERAVAATPTSPGISGAGGNAGSESDRAAAAATNSEGEAVVFTAEDVTARPPDQPPTENAPESEKAGLIFERS